MKTEKEIRKRIQDIEIKEEQYDNYLKEAPEPHVTETEFNLMVGSCIMALEWVLE